MPFCKKMANTYHFRCNYLVLNVLSVVGIVQTPTIHLPYT